MVAAVHKANVIFDQEHSQVCKKTREIRRRWTPEQREFRAELARQKMLALLPQLLCHG